MICAHYSLQGSTGSSFDQTMPTNIMIISVLLPSLRYQPEARASRWALAADIFEVAGTGDP